MAMAMAMAAETATVQQVTKASSDQLLSKFAELDSEPDPVRAQCSRLQMVRAPVVMRRKRSKRLAAGLGARDVVAGGVDVTAALAAAVKRRRSGGLGEWNKGLLGPPSSSRRSGSVLRKMGIGRAEQGTAALLAALEKTWRRTVEGASRVFIEKHCSTHVRLISDAV